MSSERDDTREGFLSRWSRVKTEAREVQAAPPAPAPVEPHADDEAPELPPVEELTIDSDFSGFFHPRVDEDLRRSALRKLFSDPHFNVMDGLDIYIDDYSKTEPIPAAMLASLKQAQRIFEWAAETEEAAELRRANVPTLHPAPALEDAPPQAAPDLSPIADTAPPAEVEAQALPRRNTEA